MNSDAPRTTGPGGRDDAWEVIGPGGGGTMIRPTVSPHDPDVVCLFCDMTGAYISRNGGDSWRMFNLRNWVAAFAYDPSDPKVIYAANAALWRSEDTGRTWSMVWPDPGRSVEHMRGDHADYCISSEDPSYPSLDCKIVAVAADPGDPACLYIAVRISVRQSGEAKPGLREKPTRLYRSQDRGASWSPAGELPPQDIRAIHIQPAAGGKRTVYVVGSTGVYRGDGGNWQRRAGPDGLSLRFAGVGSAAGAAEPTIYATTEASWRGKKLRGGIYVSRDGGATWQGTGEHLLDDIARPGQCDPPRYRAISCCATCPDVAYAGMDGVHLGEGARDPVVLGGIARTADGGRSWVWVLREFKCPAENMQVSWVERRAAEGGPNIHFVGPSSLGVAPSDPDICFASDMFRSYRTGDGGDTWRQLNSLEMGEDRWRSTGLDVTTCYGVHFDPFDVGHVFITYTDIGLFHSRDGGASWTGATVGIPQKWQNTTYWLAFDPEVRDLLWGAFAFHHDLPRPKMWQHRDRIDYEGGVAVSADGGSSWTVTNDGMGETAATDILLDPTSPAGRRTLYVCGFGRGVFKSTDNGRSWALKNNGIAGDEPFAWRLTRADDGTLYLLVARRSDHGRIGDADDGALYKSTDGAASWVRMPLPEGVNGPDGLTLDPEDNRRMYLSAWCLNPPAPNTGGGVFLSEDAGQSWRRIFDEMQHVYDVTVDPKNANVLYCCGFESAAYRSADRGRSWTRIRGYNFHWGHRVVSDPADEGKIYIATYGGSVWHGPACGDPDAVEDIVTPLPREA